MNALPTKSLRAPGRPRTGFTRAVRFMQLQELVLAMGLGLTIVGAAFETGFRTWHSCEDRTNGAAQCVEMKVIRKAWRTFVHECTAPVVLTPSGTLTAGSHVARAGKRDLILESPSGTRSVPLPPGARVAFNVEDGGRGTRLAVLNVETHNHVQGVTQTRRSRIVACAAAEAAGTHSGDRP